MSESNASPGRSLPQHADRADGCECDHVICSDAQTTTAEQKMGRNATHGGYFGRKWLMERDLCKCAVASQPARSEHVTVTGGKFYDR